MSHKIWRSAIIRGANEPIARKYTNGGYMRGKAEVADQALPK